MDVVGCHTFSGLISMFVFDILQIRSGYIAPTCIPMARGLYVSNMYSNCRY